MKARVIKSHQREFECLLDDGQRFKARALGNLMKSDGTVVVGDEVIVKKDDQLNEYRILEVLPRKSEIFRWLVRESKKKVTAANCDLLVIVCSVSKPPYKRGIIDRFILRAHQWRIRPIVVFNKMDEYSDESLDLCFEADRLKFLEIDSFEISALNNEYKNNYLTRGIEELKNTLKDKTSIFLGQSGVGKSQTINCLSEGRFELPTKKIGKSGKGSHTTTWSEIIDCGNFFLIDSPGIRQFSLEDVEADDFISYFPDLENIAVNCSFRNCQHNENSKNCAFYNPSNFDSLHDYELIHSRLSSYRHLLDEISQIPDWKKS